MVGGADRSRLACVREFFKTLKRRLDGLMEVINRLFWLANRTARDYHKFHWFRFAAYLNVDAPNLQSSALFTCLKRRKTNLKLMPAIGPENVLFANSRLLRVP
jgi:hypothetical protein